MEKELLETHTTGDIPGSALQRIRELEEKHIYCGCVITELIDIYEHPEHSNKEWKDAVIATAREKGYGEQHSKKCNHVFDEQDQICLKCGCLK